MRFLVSIVTAVMLYALAAEAEQSLPAKYVSASDGDTVVVDLSDSIPPVLGKKIPVRVAHIDTPEIHSSNKCEKIAALKAKAETDRVLSEASKISLENPRRDKYFRILADVIYDGKSLSELLLKKKLAVAYEGNTKQKINWCKN